MIITTEPMPPTSKQFREFIKSHLEANLLDGDAIQDGQMIASSEIVDYIVTSLLPELFERAEALHKQHTSFAYIEGFFHGP